jgi:hypothetical protein
MKHFKAALNVQPAIQTVVLPGDSQFLCATCNQPGDRIVGCQNFSGELVGGRKSCAACEHHQAVQAS